MVGERPRASEALFSEWIVPIHAPTKSVNVPIAPVPSKVGNEIFTNRSNIKWFLVVVCLLSLFTIVPFLPVH